MDLRMFLAECADARKERYMDRTCEIIERHGFILLKRNNGWYLHQHTNLASGFDAAVWGTRPAALHIDSLEWAFVLAKHYEAKVVSYYPKRSK